MSKLSVIKTFEALNTGNERYLKLYVKTKNAQNVFVAFMEKWEKKE